MWRTETEFVAKRPPLAIDKVTFAHTIGEIPGDFAKWANYETASHVEMLRAFAQRRPQREDLAAAVRCLSEELEAIEPGALERCRGEADVLAARSDLLGREETQRPTKAIEPTPISWGTMRRFPSQAALMLALYGLYRLVRPDGDASGFVLPLDQLSPGAVFDVLMWVYGNVHVPASFLFLAWVFFRRHGAFEFLRNAVITTAVVAVIPYLFLSDAYSSDPSHGLPSSAVPTMPALHLAIGVMVGLWGVLLCRSLAARLLWLGYPFLALGAVIASQPKDLELTIVGAVAAVLLGLLVANIAGYWRASWRGPRLPMLRLPRLPTLPHY